MRNVSDRVFRGNKDILCSITFFLKSCRLWYN